MARLILDTGVLIEGARRRLPPGAIGAEDDVAIPAVAVAEYRVGVLLDPDPARRATNTAFLEQVLEITPIAEYTTAVIEHHAALLAHSRTAGQPWGAHDLIIAATARATGRLLVTTDARAGFGELPQVQVRLLERSR